MMLWIWFLIAGLLTLVGGGLGIWHLSSKPSGGPRPILDERLARGEISIEEYRERLAVVGARHGSRPLEVQVSEELRLVLFDQSPPLPVGEITERAEPFLSNSAKGALILSEEVVEELVGDDGWHVASTARLIRLPLASPAALSSRLARFVRARRVGAALFLLSIPAHRHARGKDQLGA